MTRRICPIVITHVGWHGDVVTISQHRTIRTARKALIWALNNGYEQLGLRRGEEITLVGDGVHMVGTVR